MSRGGCYYMRSCHAGGGKPSGERRGGNKVKRKGEWGKTVQQAEEEDQAIALGGAESQTPLPAHLSFLGDTHAPALLRHNTCTRASAPLCSADSQVPFSRALALDLTSMYLIPAVRTLRAQLIYTQIYAEHTRL